MNTVISNSTFRTFIRLLSLSKPYMGWYLLIIFASLLSTVIGLGIMEATRRIITGASDKVPALIYSGLFVGLAAIVLQFANNIAISWLKATFYNRSTTRLQMRLLHLVSTKKMSELAEYHSSDLYGRITDSVAEAQRGLNDKFPLFFTNIVQLGVAFTYFSWLNMTLTIGMLCFALAFPVLTYPLTGRLRNQHDLRNCEGAHSGEFLQDAIQGGHSVRALSLRAYFSSKYREKLDHVRKRDLVIAAYDGVFDYANRALMFGGMLFILGFGGYQVLQGSLNIGGLTAFMVASGKLTGPIRSIAGIWNELISSISHTGRFQSLLDSSKEHKEERADIVFHHEQGVSLHLSHIYYAYKKGPSVLNNINMTANRGELTAIIGRSGSGKTTLLKLLSKLLEPTSGNIYCNSTSLHDLSANEWYSQIALVGSTHHCHGSRPDHRRGYT
ncbi:ABC transporter ATP-binding protein/permease [Paenibacillus sp. sptzw28]|uniref:ABC transporter transmembrane domain-containing protein n=1 Tax=Paenibacillus sp. sptzw28 TaxID=715179 RepID=UPI001C6EAE11|nr:ABC transporter ATP-binding protein [Paenibacillus sp. sptzw28]QYR20296.1 ABC transporter ATP-binding protein/permease [Paenibacillus sp. sptzw28]